MTGSETNGFVGETSAEPPAAGLIPQQRDAYSAYAECYALSLELSDTE